MARIFFLPYLGNRSKSDTCSYELFCLESHILSFPKVLQIPPESPCINRCSDLTTITAGSLHITECYIHCMLSIALSDLSKTFLERRYNFRVFEFGLRQRQVH